MEYKYQIDGMTCQNCKAIATNALIDIDGVTYVDINLETKEATIVMDHQINISTLQKKLPDKYSITKKKEHALSTSELSGENSKLNQLKPLFLILIYLIATSILLHRKDWNVIEMMTDFMGLFFIVFSFFKILDLSGFATTFSMYDPIAKNVPFYANVYPFIETILGLMLLLRYNVEVALMVTIFILGCTTYGVTKVILSKKTIKCACLGTVLNLPMTEATFIENALMIIMSILMLIIGIN